MSFNIIHLPSLPRVPEELINFSRDLDVGYIKSKPGRMLKRDGQEFVEGFNSRQHISPDLDAWLRTNIISDWAHVGYHRFSPPCMGAHLDRSRFFALNYIIETGGPDVATVFYKSKNHQLDCSYDDSRVDDYDQLTVDDVYYCKPKNWYLLNVRNLIHSVENIQSMRASIQIGFWKNPLDSILTFN